MTFPRWLFPAGFSMALPHPILTGRAGLSARERTIETQSFFGRHHGHPWRRRAVQVADRRRRGGSRAGEQYPVSKSPEEWRQQLTPEQYYVLREHGTERAGTSPLNNEKRSGTFVCAGCEQDLFVPTPI